MEKSMQEDKKPVLSISLLSSGRKKTIRKCLDSLKPLMEQLDCELIIVDTGCDEETHELLLEYTDQVIPFTWCNDFSKARNAGLEKAKGEWFLYIDDDEWFIDVQEIVEFFVSGEYKKYGAANYIQRNYLDRQEKRYQDSWVSRMIRLDKDTRFTSSIHEYLQPQRGVCKLLHSAVKHFGYIFDTPKEKYEHSRRNVSLLQDMIQKERDNLRWWIQLANEYRGMREFRKLHELCQEALDMIHELDDPQANRYRGTFYAGILIAEISQYNEKAALAFFEKAIQDKRNTQMCKAKLYSLGAELYYKEKEYDKCEYFSKKYMRIKEKLEGDEIALLAQGSFFISDVFDDENRSNVYCFYISSRLGQGDLSVLKQYFWKLGWKEENLYLYISVVSDIIEAMAAAEFNRGFVEIVQTMMDRKGVQQKVIEVLQKKEAEDEDGFIRLCRIFTEVDSSHYYIWYMKIKYAGYAGEIENLAQCYQELFKKVENLFQLKDFVFDVAIKYQINLEPFFEKIPFEQWKRGVDIFCRQAFPERRMKRKEMMESMYRAENPRYDYFFLKIAEAEAISDEDSDFYEIRDRLEQFTKRNLEFYGRYFKENAFSGEMEMLPAACRLAVGLRRVFQEEQEAGVKQVGECLKKCLGVYRPMDGTIKRYAKLYASEQSKLLQKRNEASDELQTLAGQIKEKVRFLLKEEKYQEALAVCEQLKRLLPADEEVLALEEQAGVGVTVQP